MLCLALVCFAACGLKVSSVLREWRMTFYSPVLSFWACFVPLAFFLCGPLEGCPFAFWSCIKEEMGEKKHYWFCVLSDWNTEDRKTHKELGVGSGAAPSLVCEPEGDGGDIERGRRWGGTPDNTNASLPRVVCSVLSLPSFLLSFLFLMAE